MKRPLLNELLIVFTIMASAVVIGIGFDNIFAALFIAMFGYFCWHLFHLYVLYLWLKKSHAPAPQEAIGIWGEIFYQIYRLQKRHRGRKKKLKRFLKRYRESTAAMPDATVVMTHDNQVEWWNDAAEALLGLKAPQDSGQPLTNLLRNPQLAKYLAGDDFSDAINITSPVSNKHTLSIQVIPYGDNQRLLLSRDITRLIQLENMRRDFIANVSHELRTPLTVISGYIETLMNRPNSADNKDYEKPFQQMQQQAIRMQRIVTDLLFLSKLETGAPPEMVEVHVPNLILGSLEEAQTLSGERNHSFESEIDNELYLIGVENELHSVISNLLSNAVRYSAEGGTIHVRWHCDKEGAHLSVEDTGEGIPIKDIPRLTERFYRVDTARSRHSGGTGLGLAIVNHVMSRHQGVLSIESTPGKGSKFSCHFPAKSILIVKADQ